MSHDLGDYELLIYDDEYAETGQKYKSIAIDVKAYWDAFIDVCTTIKGEAMEGQLADALDATVITLGKTPGATFLSEANSQALLLQNYIQQMDEADKELY